MYKRTSSINLNNDNDTKNTMDKPIVISISSGKGGVGKTLTTVNFAMAARKIGMRVLIFDGDLGLSNVDVVLGLHARYNIRDVLDGEVTIEDVIIKGPLGISIIPSGSGIASLQQLTYVQKQILSEELESLNGKFDLILIDTGAGIADNVIHLNRSADKIIVVTTPEPHAMTDAYALVKVLNERSKSSSSRRNQRQHVGLLVNMSRTDSEAEGVARRISDVAREFLDTELDYLGAVPFDPQVTRAVLTRKAASESSVHTISGQAWNRIIRKVLKEAKYQVEISRGGADAPNFWQNLVQFDRPIPEGINQGLT